VDDHGPASQAGARIAQPAKIKEAKLGEIVRREGPSAAEPQPKNDNHTGRKGRKKMEGGFFQPALDDMRNLREPRNF
jgi:hypothetical protein